MPAMPLPPAMQRRCLARPGRNVAWPSGPKTPRRDARDGVPEEPLAHRPVRLLLHHERQALRAPIEVDHGIGAGPRDAGHGEQRELPRLEVERLVEADVEGHHVVGQPPVRLDHATERPGRGRLRLARLQDPHLEPAVLVRHALAREDLGGALQVPVAGRVGPVALVAPAHERGLAGAARAGRALVGQLDATPERGVQDLLPGGALEVPRAIAGADRDLHPYSYIPASRRPRLGGGNGSEPGGGGRRGTACPSLSRRETPAHLPHEAPQLRQLPLQVLGHLLLPLHLVERHPPRTARTTCLTADSTMLYQARGRRIRQPGVAASGLSAPSSGESGVGRCRTCFERTRLAAKSSQTRMRLAKADRVTAFKVR